MFDYSANTNVDFNFIKNNLDYEWDYKALSYRNDLPFEFFCETNSCINEYAYLMKWALQQNSHYLPQAISDFADINRADAWLIAQAQYSQCTVVTYEVADSKRKKTIKIPDVCSVDTISPSII